MFVVTAIVVVGIAVIEIDVPGVARIIGISRSRPKIRRITAEVNTITGILWVTRNSPFMPLLSIDKTGPNGAQ
jgi:hypothetical protein